MPLSATPGDDRVERLADRGDSSDGRGDLAHRALDLARGVLALGAVRGDRAQLVVGVRRGSPARGRLEQALRDEIGIATVRRGRVRVVVDREPEVARCRDRSRAAARTRRDRAASRPTATGRRSAPDRRAALRARNSESATRVGSAGSCVPSACASSTMRSQRFGARTTRRIDERAARLEEARGRAVRRDHEVFDELARAVLVRELRGRRPRRPSRPGAPRSSRARARRARCGARAGAARPRPAARAASAIVAIARRLAARRPRATRRRSS